MGQQVKPFLAEQTRAEQERQASSIAEQPAEQDNVHEPIERIEQQASRMETFLTENAPKRGKRGKEGQSNVTDNDSTKRQTAHGVMQGYNGQALVEAQPHVILHAEAFGNGKDDGQVAPMLDGVQASGGPLGCRRMILQASAAAPTATIIAKPIARRVSRKSSMPISLTRANAIPALPPKTATSRPRRRSSP